MLPMFIRMASRAVTMVLLCLAALGIAVDPMVEAVEAQEQAAMEIVAPDLPVREGSLAVCYAGTARTFPLAYPKHISLMLEPLKPSEFHSFFVMDLTNAMDTPKGGEYNYTREQLQGAFDALHAKTVLVTDPSPSFDWDHVVNAALQSEVRATTASEGGSGEESSHTTGGCYDWCLIQFTRLHLCMEEIERQELLQGWRYDWFLRIRPDLQPDTQHTSLAHLQRGRLHAHIMAHGGAIHDAYALMTRDLASTYFDIATRTDECPSPAWCKSHNMLPGCVCWMRYSYDVHHVVYEDTKKWSYGFMRAPDARVGWIPPAQRQYVPGRPEYNPNASRARRRNLRAKITRSPL